MAYFFEKVDSNNMRKWEVVSEYNLAIVQKKKADNATAIEIDDDVKNIALKGNMKYKDTSDFDSKLTAENSDLDSLIALFDNDTEQIQLEKIIE